MPDQLRGDMITRFDDRFGDGGFNWLLEHGVHYANAHYEHANTETIVGHACLATGAQPRVHGMVANVWLDRGLGRLVYNIEDPDERLLTADADVDDAAEIDPTQRTAKVEGRSPKALLVSTFGDELSVNTAGKAKVFGVSVKDRGAVSMAGHTGTAYWFSKASGEFVSSSYYMDGYPDWVNAFNAADHPTRYAGTQWTLLHEQSSYQYGDADDKPWETALPGWGRVFPHTYGPADGKMFTTLLTLSPAGDELTLDFALELMENEELGKDEVTDYLAISFSSTDYVGHIFGPSSLEAEDNLLRLDRTIARLLTALDARVGLDNTIIVLSSDHGGPEAPGALSELGLRSDYVQPESWDRAPAIAALKQRFGLAEELIDQYFHPYLYLNRELIAAKGLDQGEVEQAVAEVLTDFDGVALAVSSSALRSGNLPGHTDPAVGAQQLQPAALGRHLRGLRSPSLHQRLRRVGGGVHPRLALELRHLRAGDLRRTGSRGPNQLPTDQPPRHRTDPGGARGRQASVRRGGVTAVGDHGALMRHPTVPPRPEEDLGTPGVSVSADELARLEHRARGFSFLPRQPLHSLLSGRRGSRVRGRGLDFDEIRRYLPGDDPRTIDWKITQRTGTAHVRVFTEERDRPAMVVVDQRSSMFFGTRVAMKSVVAAQLAALAAWRVVGQGDRVGGVVFSDTEIREVRPHRSRRRVMQLLGDTSTTLNQRLSVESRHRRARARSTRPYGASSRSVRHSSLVVVISDFPRRRRRNRAPADPAGRAQ
jgi:predicted AlkP superfamily pyrophosphatase or phosphodiesterase